MARTLRQGRTLIEAATEEARRRGLEPTPPILAEILEWLYRYGGRFGGWNRSQITRLGNQLIEAGGILPAKTKRKGA